MPIPALLALSAFVELVSPDNLFLFAKAVSVLLAAVLLIGDGVKPLLE